MTTRNGFTLFEVLLAVLILGTSLLGITQGLSRIIAAHQRLRAGAEALFVAEEILHEREWGAQTFRQGQREGYAGPWQWQFKEFNHTPSQPQQVELALIGAGHDVYTFRLVTTLRPYQRPAVAAAAPRGNIN